MELFQINPGSIAARCGLEIGDNISAIDSCPTNGLKHKEAQDLIVKAGNNIQLSVCRQVILLMSNEAVLKVVIV